MALSLSEHMSRIKSRDTGPEVLVRSYAHRLGYRFGLHDSGLPGSPDIVFRCRRCVVLVHGCFWHQHSQCRSGHQPKSNSSYWKPKLERNVARARRNIAALREAGWRVLVLWECQVRDVGTVCWALIALLDGGVQYVELPFSEPVGIAGADGACWRHGDGGPPRAGKEPAPRAVEVTLMARDSRLRRVRLPLAGPGGTG